MKFLGLCLGGFVGEGALYACNYIGKLLKSFRLPPPLNPSPSTANQLLSYWLLYKSNSDIEFALRAKGERTGADFPNPQIKCNEVAVFFERIGINSSGVEDPIDILGN